MVGVIVFMYFRYTTIEYVIDFEGLKYLLYICIRNDREQQQLTRIQLWLNL